MIRTTCLRLPDLDAARFGDVVLLAVPAAVAEEARGPAEGKVVIDCTNSVAPGRFVLDEPAMAAKIAATSARVMKALNLCHVDLCGACQAVRTMFPPLQASAPDRTAHTS
jgi:hypothetical protein